MCFSKQEPPYSQLKTKQKRISLNLRTKGNILLFLHVLTMIIGIFSYIIGIFSYISAPDFDGLYYDKAVS